MLKMRNKQKMSYSHLSELEKTYVRWKGMQEAERDIIRMKSLKLGEEDERTD